MDQVNENTDRIVTVSFFDEDDNPVTPDSATYRVDDAGSDTSIVALTALSGLSTTKDITISAAQNVMINTRKAFETRVLTVQFKYNSTKRGTAEYRYQLVNLAFVNGTLSPV